jgi:hypothetical protein
MMENDKKQPCQSRAVTAVRHHAPDSTEKLNMEFSERQSGTTVQDAKFKGFLVVQQP